MKFIIVIAIFAAILGSLVCAAEANKWFVKNNGWKKPSDCTSLYGNRCGKCCGDFGMHGHMEGRIISTCKCYPVD